MKKILIVADEIKTALSLKEKLEDAMYQVDFALNVPEAMRLSLVNSYSLIISDAGMPVINGVELCSALQQWGVTTPTLILTSFGPGGVKLCDLEQGGNNYLIKPFGIKDLLDRVNTLIKS